MRVPSETPLHFRWAEAQALERMEASAETVVDSDEQTHRAAVHPRLGMSDPIRPLARGAMRLARVRGVPLAGEALGFGDLTPPTLRSNRRFRNNPAVRQCLLERGYARGGDHYVRPPQTQKRRDHVATLVGRLIAKI